MRAEFNKPSGPDGLHEPEDEGDMADPMLERFEPVGSPEIFVSKIELIGDRGKSTLKHWLVVS